MNGTDLPTLNIYGNCGVPTRQSVGVYAYPRDIRLVTERIRGLTECRGELVRTMADQGFVVAPQDAFVPIYVHRFVVCTASPESSVVLSIADESDAIVYGKSLQEYLEKEFLEV